MPSVAKIIRRRQRRKIRRQRAARRSVISKGLLLALPSALALAPLVAALSLALWLYSQSAGHLPATADGAALRAPPPTRFYDRGGATELYALADPPAAERRWLSLADLPPQLVAAISLVEAPAHGAEAASFDALATLAQLWRYIIGLPLSEADGIAGRLTRATLLPAQASGLDPRLLEIVFSAEAQRRYSPAELLEWRLNSADYGRAAYGLDAAAQLYLGKAAADVSLLEAALLAALLDTPAAAASEADLRARALALLAEMRAADLIDAAQFEAAQSAPLALRPPAAAEAPYFVEYARAQAQGILRRQGLDGAGLLARGGLRITTSLDLDLQRRAECLLQGHLQGLNGQNVSEPACASPSPAAADLSAPPDQGALSLIDVSSGQLLSWVGTAAAGRHQPAPLLRPFVYLEAFSRREYTPASMVYDLPRAYPLGAAVYRPANPDGRYHGPLSARAALAAGLLPPAVHLASEPGLAAVIDLAQAFGLSGLGDAEPALDLLERGGAVSVLDAAYAYSVFASLGQLRGIEVPMTARGRDPVAILKIQDAAGQVLWAYEAPQQTTLIEPSLAYLVNDILADDATRRAVLGPAATLALEGPAAALAGMSADKRDDWALGYTADLALALRLGRADGVPLSFAEYERAGAAPIVAALLRYAQAERAESSTLWAPPADIEERLVCEISGLLPPTPEHCPTRREILPPGSQLPADTFWQQVEINSATGLLATVNTPENLRVTRAYFSPPAEALDWWRQNGKPLPPSDYSPDGAPTAAKALQLTAPADFAYLGATVDIVGRIQRDGATSWRLEYGVGLVPESWLPIAQGQPIAGEDIAATWLTALLSGNHTLRLTVNFADGSVESDSKLLTFDNTPPAVRLEIAGGPAAAGYARGQTVSLAATASDDLAIERVEFYRDDELLYTDRDWPYGYDYRIEAVGELRLRAWAFDQVGNRATAELRLVATG